MKRSPGKTAPLSCPLLPGSQEPQPRGLGILLPGCYRFGCIRSICFLRAQAVASSLSLSAITRPISKTVLFAETLCVILSGSAPGRSEYRGTADNFYGKRTLINISASHCEYFSVDHPNSVTRRRNNSGLVNAQIISPTRFSSSPVRKGPLAATCR